MTKQKYLYRCVECGGSNVEGTAWVDLNTDRIMPSDPPTDDYWCRDCGDNTIIGEKGGAA